MAIPVFRPFIKRRDMDAVLSALLAEDQAPGFQRKQLCTELAARYACAGALSFREPRRAMELALSSLGLPPGARVGLSALAPKTWVYAARALDFEPVLLDVLPDNPCLDPEHVLAVHTQNPFAALIISHSLGYLADMKAFSTLGIPLIEDLSQAFGAAIPEGLSAGLSAPLVLLSLEYDGIVTAGGGAVLVVRQASAFSLLSSHELASDPSLELADMNAALARTQIAEVDDFLVRRAELAELFARALARSRHKMPKNRFENELARYSCVVLLESAAGEVFTYARKKGVEASLAFSACAASSETNTEFSNNLPRAKTFMLRCILFPLYPALRQKEIDLIERILATIP